MPCYNQVLLLTSWIHLASSACLVDCTLGGNWTDCQIKTRTLHCRCSWPTRTSRAPSRRSCSATVTVSSSSHEVPHGSLRRRAVQRREGLPHQTHQGDEAARGAPCCSCLRSHHGCCHCSPRHCHCQCYHHRCPPPLPQTHHRCSCLHSHHRCPTPARCSPAIAVKLPASGSAEPPAAALKVSDD